MNKSIKPIQIREEIHFQTKERKCHQLLFIDKKISQKTTGTDQRATNRLLPSDQVDRATIILTLENDQSEKNKTKSMIDYPQKSKNQALDFKILQSRELFHHKRFKFNPRKKKSARQY